MIVRQRAFFAVAAVTLAFVLVLVLASPAQAPAIPTPTAQHTKDVTP
ncbi:MULTISPECIES: hypothetical protein [unclassified Streptomyces]|nr:MULTISPECIES: hypothetical protein [unclassified Streptomyces]